MKKPCTTCEYNKRHHIITNGWGRNASWMRCTLGMEVDYGYGLDYSMRVQKCAKYRAWLEWFKEKRRSKKNMNVEETAREIAKQRVPDIKMQDYNDPLEYRHDNYWIESARNEFVVGYLMGRKSLSWQDIETIRIIMDKIEAERSFKPMSKEVYEEVLKQFNERKNG